MTRPVFFYDGDCAFCSSCARLLIDRIKPDADVLAWQLVDIDAYNVSEQDCDAAVQWIGGDGRRSAGPEAIADLLRTAGSGWRVLGRLLHRKRVLRMSWPIYDWVSRHRDRMPGGTATCALPAAERSH